MRPLQPDYLFSDNQPLLHAACTGRKAGLGANLRTWDWLDSRELDRNAVACANVQYSTAVFVGRLLFQTPCRGVSKSSCQARQVKLLGGSCDLRRNCKHMLGRKKMACETYGWATKREPQLKKSDIRETHRLQDLWWWLLLQVGNLRITTTYKTLLSKGPLRSIPEPSSCQKQ
jgi:hypothetical protein